MKMTFQPKKRQRSKVHGFRARMSTRRWKKSTCKQKSKRKKEIISLGRIYCDLFFYNKTGEIQ